MSLYGLVSISELLTTTVFTTCLWKTMVYVSMLWLSLDNILLKDISCWAWWYTSVSPALWRLRKGIAVSLNAISATQVIPGQQSYIASPSIKQNNNRIYFLSIGVTISHHGSFHGAEYWNERTMVYERSRSGIKEKTLYPVRHLDDCSCPKITDISLLSWVQEKAFVLRTELGKDSWCPLWVSCSLCLWSLQSAFSVCFLVIQLNAYYS